MKCDKCLSEDFEMKKYAYLNKNADDLSRVNLCNVCNCIYEGASKFHKDKDRLNLLSEFVKEDYGSLSVSKISKDMIDARKDRSLGKSPWIKWRQQGRTFLGTSVI